MSALIVDVVFRGRVLESVPFRGPTLRVGRMPENDVVLDNLGVSRFHARLLLEDDQVYLEDAGSENGCLVNGERIAERRAIALGDAIAIGKHELRVRLAVEGESPDARPARRKGDAWDGARTYVLDAPPRSHATTQPSPAEPSESKEPVVMAPVTEKSSAPVQIPVESVDLDGSQEIDFDFVGSLGDGEDGVPTAVVPVEESGAAATPTPTTTAPLHAGFIVQRQGKLERVAPWNGDVLVAGRSSECDIHLAQDEVSRRHVRFERSGDVYHVIDLGSVNGTFVNGKRVERHALEVGDIVQVEGFQLTFVLDRDPLDGAVAAKPVAKAPPRDDPMAMTMLQEEMPHRPGFTELLAKPNANDEPTTAAVTAIAEADLLPDDIEEIEATMDDEKPADAAPLRGSSRASSVQDLLRTSQPNLVAPELKLELRIRMDLLPAALRQAFEEAGASELVLPAELHLKR